MGDTLEPKYCFRSTSRSMETTKLGAVSNSILINCSKSQWNLPSWNKLEKKNRPQTFVSKSSHFNRFHQELRYICLNSFCSENVCFKLLSKSKTFSLAEWDFLPRKKKKKKPPPSLQLLWVLCTLPFFFFLSQAYFFFKPR